MAQVEWCSDCKRMVGITCDCGLTFAEKIKSISFETGTWAPNSKAIQRPDNYPAGGKLSPHRPSSM